MRVVGITVVVFLTVIVLIALLPALPFLIASAGRDPLLWGGLLLAIICGVVGLGFQAVGAFFGPSIKRRGRQKRETQRLEEQFGITGLTYEQWERAGAFAILVREKWARGIGYDDWESYLRYYVQRVNQGVEPLDLATTYQEQDKNRAVSVADRVECYSRSAGLKHEWVSEGNRRVCAFCRAERPREWTA